MSVARIGDMTGGFGKIITGAYTVLAEGRPVATVGSMVSPHLGKPKPRHKFGVVVMSGSPTVYAEFKPIARVGSMCNCFHSVITGSITVLTI